MEFRQTQLLLSLPRKKWDKKLHHAAQEIALYKSIALS